MSAGSAPLPDPLGRLLAADLDVPAAQAPAFRQALGSVLTRHPEMRGASAYPTARGAIVVRLMLRSGWIPVLVPASERTDRSALERRLESALRS